MTDDNKGQQVVAHGPFCQKGLGRLTSREIAEKWPSSCELGHRISKTWATC